MAVPAQERAPQGPGEALPTRPGPASVAWKIHRETVMLLGWGRAILLQFAHPAVAQGVADHSVFLNQPRARLRRLRSTIEAMLALTFGDNAAAQDAADRINAIHDRVRGQLRSSTSVFPAGTGYSAHDPKLLKWVHATLLDSFLLTYELCVAPLSPEEKDRYCLESSSMEGLLGIPAGYLPRNLRQLQDYMEGMYRSGEIEITEPAQTLAHEVLYPGRVFPLQPFLWLERLFTIGTLPAPIRSAYGFAWSARQKKALAMWSGIIRGALPLVPPVLRYWKIARVQEQSRLRTDRSS
ncbi:MAG TPA: oxygenase MpaB family protein [Candidatus Acidoferrales bacterium]|nr:oxygenase MpaB family protein [Candidatus Acidoferrales bacterium]